MSEQQAKKLSNAVIKMIEKGASLNKEFVDTLLADSRNSRESLRPFIEKACKSTNAANTSVDNQRVYRILIDAVSEYLPHFPMPAEVKRQLYRKIYDLCEYLGKEYKICNYESCLRDIPNQFADDFSVELVKELHDRKGVSKMDLADKYHISPRTVQDHLHRLSQKACSNPLRIGGQSIFVQVSHREETSRTDIRRYFTPNTLNPLVLQLNLMQTATLLQSLYLNYESGNNIPLDLAIDVWGQLSGYAQERIRKIFCQKDAGFAKFIDMVSNEAQNPEYRFMTESELIEQGNISLQEMLVIAHKGGGTYNLTLSSPVRSRKNQRISYDIDKKSYYAVPAGKLSAERLYFAEEELTSLAEA